MDTDINDIWHLPVESSIRHPPVDTPDDEGLASPPHPSNRPLFLPSDDEDDAAPPATKHSANKDPDVDALFEGLDDIDDTVHELAPSLDLDALRREADARNARAVRAEIAASIPGLSAAAADKTDKGKGGGALDGIDDGGEDGEKKKRKPVAKLDEARLLGMNGLPQLLKDTKNFKPKGKGHEVHFHFLSCFLVDQTRCLLRQPTWIACSKYTNSGPTSYIPKLDSRRRWTE
jgi:replication fork protection complex subunit Csm3/Swi3